jgi:hypothetical protein
MINLTFDSENKQIHISATSIIEMTDVYIDTQNTFNCIDEPSTKAMHLSVESVLEDDNLYHLEIDINLVSFSLGSSMLGTDISKDLFIVFIKQQTYTYITDSTYNEDYLMKYMFDTLSKALINKGCCTNVNNISTDILLAYNAFKIADSYVDKIYFWNMIYYNEGSNQPTCGCNGK